MVDNQNLFDDLAPPPAEAQSIKADDEPASNKPNLFDDLDPNKPLANETSALGAAARSAAMSTLPAVGTLTGAAAGAETGGALGLLAGPAAPIAAPAGAFLGGLIGGFGGAEVVSKVQDWALSKLPDSWRDPLEEKLKAGQIEHPTASFIGGLAPFALTMRPGGLGKAAALPENSTALQRLMANPITSRLFGGALMGGLELGQEAAQGQEPDWTNVAIATGFGTIFNRPTRIGETIEGWGARAGAPIAARIAAIPAAQRGRAPMAAQEALDANTGLPREMPTLAEAHDLGVMGPGVTEETFKGGEQQSPETQSEAQNARRQEMGPAEADLHAKARQMEPEAFERADALDAERESIRSRLSDLMNPTDSMVADAEKARDDLQAQLDAHVEAHNGYTGGADARRMRAQIRDAQRQVDELGARREAWASGEAQETDETAALRARLTQATMERMDAGREIAAALRRADEHVNGAPVEEVAPQPELEVENAAVPETQEPVRVPPAAAAVAEEDHGAPVGAGATPEMRQRIVDDVAQRLISVGIDSETAQAWGRVEAANLATFASWHPELTAEELYRQEGLSFRNIAFAEFQRERAEGARKAKAVLKPKDGELIVNGQKITGEAAERLRAKVDEAERNAPRAEGEIEPIIVNGQEITGQAAAMLRKAMERTEAKAPEPAPPAATVDEVRERLDAMRAEEPEPVVAPAPETPAEPAEEPPKTVIVKSKRAVTRKFPSLFEMLAAEGGLAPNPELNAILDKNPFIPGFGRLIREGGRTLDDATSTARELGYLHDEAEHEAGESKLTINHLLDKLREESHGSKVYSAHDHAEMAEEQARKDSKQYDKDVKAAAKALKNAPGLKADEEWSPEPEIMDRAAHLMARDSELEPVDAYQEALFERARALIEDFDQDERLHDARVDETGKIPGWDEAAAEPWLHGRPEHVRDIREEGEGTGTERPIGEGGQHGPSVEAVYAQGGFEPGAEGKPQQLIPGIAPITDRERAELAAGKPLRGGNRAPPEGGLFDEDARNQQELFQSGPATTFYSAVGRAIESAKQEKASPQQWLATIRNTAGVKPEEMKWLGVEDWLKDQSGPVTRAQIADYVRANSIELKEVTKGAPPAPLPPEQQKLVDSAKAKLTEGWRFLPQHLLNSMNEGDLNLARATVRDVKHWETEGVITPDEAEAIRAYDLAQRPFVSAPKYEGYRLPGGDNYREMLLTLPPKAADPAAIRAVTAKAKTFGDKMLDWRDEHPDEDGRDSPDYMRLVAQRNAAMQEATALQDAANGANYKSAHWDEPNILSHIRFDDRTGPNGEKVLHIAEVQSDWHQEGRRSGYTNTEAKAQRDALIQERETLSQSGALTRAEGRAEAMAKYEELSDKIAALHDAAKEGVPDAPFKTSWPELAMKRMLRYAVDHGYDRLSWDTGATSAERYDLSKQVDHLLVKKNDDGTYKISAQAQGRGHMVGEAIAEEKLEDYVGKDVAKRIVEGAGEKTNLGGNTTSQPPDIWHRLSGLDLKVGGEGMKGFYDDILPKAVNKLVKKFGARVDRGSVAGGATDVDRTIPDEQAGAEHAAEWERLNQEISAARARLGRFDPADSEVERLENQRELLHNRMVRETIERNPSEKIPVHSVEITDDLAHAAAYEGFPLFQDAKAAINLPSRMVSLFEKADFSSLVHEGAHAFLDRMRRFAVHSNAPEQLKNDFQSVLNWFNADARGNRKPSTAEEIQTRHHEKFARAFERYITEGRAPTQGLAGVFEKMKRWMLDIYQGLRGIKAPINDEIRGVFDRMLTEEPQRHVVAEAPEPTMTLADVHHADAQTIEPHEAGPAADRIDAEKVRQWEEAHDDDRGTAPAPGPIPSAAQAQPAGSGGGERAEGGGAGENRKRPENAKKAGEVPTPASQERAGGIGAAQETSGVGGGKPAANPSPTEQLAPRPVESPIGQPSRLQSVDNLVREVAGDNQEAAKALHELMKDEEGFVGDTRGPITHGQTIEMAAAIGMAPEDLSRQIGQAHNAEQLWTYFHAIQKMNDRVWKAGQSGGAVLYEQEKALRAAIIKQFVGARAEAGRALGIFNRMLKEMGAGAAKDETFFQTWKEITGRNFFQSHLEAQMAGREQSPEGLAQFLNDSEKRTFGRMLFEYWVNGLISGPVTHITYSVGNTVSLVQKLGPETAIAAALHAIRGGEGPGVRLGEVPAGIKGIVKGAVPATEAALRSLRAGATIELPGEKNAPYARGASLPLNEAATVHDVKAAAFGLARGLYDSIRAVGAIVEPGQSGSPAIALEYSSRGVIPNVRIGAGELPIGDIARAPGNFIAAFHSFTRALAYSVEKNALAYRQAATEGLTGADLDKRVAELSIRPTQDMMEAGHREASVASLMGTGGQFTRKLSSLVNQIDVAGFPLGKFIMPFVHISTNVLEEAMLKRTPLGFLAPEIRKDLMGGNGPIAQEKAGARMMWGVSLALTAGALAAEGFLTGSGPDDYKERSVWQAAGKQPYSVRIGDTWYSYKRLGPLGVQLGIAADLYDLSRTAATTGDMSDAAGRLIHAVAQNVLDESFVRGPADLLRAIHDPERYGGYYVRSELASFVPFSAGMSQVARAVDPYTRDARTVVDAIKAKIPFVSEGLRPKIDIWGNPVPSREGLGFDSTAIWEQKQSSDPVNLEMMRLGYWPSAVERKIRGVHLTDEQHDEYSTVAGHIAKQNLDRVISSPQWQYIPDHVRKDLIDHTFRSTREAARGWMMSRHRDIPIEAVQRKREGLK